MRSENASVTKMNFLIIYTFKGTGMNFGNYVKPRNRLSNWVTFVKIGLRIWRNNEKSHVKKVGLITWN